MTRAGLERKGLILRTPPGRRVLEVPAEFAWDQQALCDRMNILRAFGFQDHEFVASSRMNPLLGTNAYQFSQETIMDNEPQPQRFTKTDVNFEALAKQLGIETDMGKLALEEALTNIQLLDRKHKDYGPGNISRFGLKGCLVRGSDKLERILNLENAETAPAFESVEDNLRDWSNYGVIGLLCKKGLWR